MNTYSDCAWQGDAQVQAFHYPAVGVAGANDSAEDESDQDQLQARNEGVREGVARARHDHEQALKREREGVKKAIEDFQQERDSYYQRVEAEVVQLALAIARKVLHREAQVDPLLLAGIVRVALRKLEIGTRVRVRVNPSEVTGWQKILAEMGDAGAVPEIEEDATVPPARCVLQTELGVTELGIEPQLKEIENGLLDLLAKRPQVRQ
jgi:flagellar assembly protein FliH